MENKRHVLNGWTEHIHDLQRDFARFYRLHNALIRRIWQYLSQQQRTKFLKHIYSDSGILKHPADKQLVTGRNKEGERLEIVVRPDWNLRDLASSPDTLLDMMAHRANMALSQQFLKGPNGAPGDYQCIQNMIKSEPLLSLDARRRARSERGPFISFHDDALYGKWIEGTEHYMFKSQCSTELGIPYEEGWLILERQHSSLHALTKVGNELIGGHDCYCLQVPDFPQDKGAEALAQLSIHAAPRKLELSDLKENCLEQCAALEDYAFLLHNEPIFLTRDVKHKFYSRPEYVPDDKGRPGHRPSDKFISAALFDAVDTVLKAQTVWKYISLLLELLLDNADKQFCNIILQELAVACSVEYTRAQSNFRQMNATCGDAVKWFKVVSASDHSQRIALKRNPESLTTVDPQQHYRLRLCQNETTWEQAAEWLQKLEDLHRAHPTEKTRIEGAQTIALGHLATIVTFMQDLSKVVKIPVLSKKKAQSFAHAYQTLDKDLTQLKAAIDVQDLVIPMNVLMSPKRAERALLALEKQIFEKKNASLHKMYEDLVEDCVAALHTKHEAQKAKLQERQPEVGIIESEQNEKLEVQLPKQKIKTRPEQLCAEEVGPNTLTPGYCIEWSEAQSQILTPSDSNDQPVQTAEIFKVRASTYTVFFTMFSRTSEAHGSVNWDSFTAAMADLNFSIIPKTGSIYTFVPPEHMAVRRKLTIHRPHHSRIEGAYLFCYSRRLNRVYGWDDSSFVV